MNEQQQQKFELSIIHEDLMELVESEIQTENPEILSKIKDGKRMSARCAIDGTKLSNEELRLLERLMASKAEDKTTSRGHREWRTWQANKIKKFREGEPVTRVERATALPKKFRDFVDDAYEAITRTARNSVFLYEFSLEELGKLREAIDGYVPRSDDEEVLKLQALMVLKRRTLSEQRWQASKPAPAELVEVHA